MKEQKLYTKYNNYFKEALDFLNKESREGKDIPEKPEEEIEFKVKKEIFGRSVEYKFIHVLKKDYFLFISNKWDLLKNLKSYKICLKYLNDNKYIKDYIEEQDFLLDPIQTFAESTKGFKFAKDEIDKIYNKIEDFIFSKSIKFSCSARLSGFESDADEINIDEFTKIKKYSEAECKELWRRSSFIRSSIGIISPLDYRLEIIFNKNKEDLRRYAGEGQDELNKALLLLRLFKSSTLRTGIIETKAIQWIPFSGIASSGLEEKLGGSYKLTKDEVPALIRLWNVIKNITYLNCPSLEIAIHRFNFAHERYNLEDRLIDIMIGFEALYLDDDKELRYKSAIRTAILIGKTLEDRKRIFKMMLSAYDQRSNLVHGGKLDQKVKIAYPVSQEFDINAFIDAIKNYLSISIKTFAYLSAIYTHKQILDKIHQSTLVAGIAL